MNKRDIIIAIVAVLIVFFGIFSYVSSRNKENTRREELITKVATAKEKAQEEIAKLRDLQDKFSGVNPNISIMQSISLRLDELVEANNISLTFRARIKAVKATKNALTEKSFIDQLAMIFATSTPKSSGLSLVQINEYNNLIVQAQQEIHGIQVQQEVVVQAEAEVEILEQQLSALQSPTPAPTATQSTSPTPDEFQGEGEKPYVPPIIFDPSAPKLIQGQD